MDEIVYHNRYTGENEIEKVYGDKALRWTYGSVAGRISLSLLVKRAAFSHWYGWRMDQPQTKAKIAPFVEEFGLDATEFACDVDDFANFNEFFSRQLHPEARPIDASNDSVVFPADGRHLCIPDLSRSSGLFVKGETFDISTLLKGDALANRYANGSLLLSRLCPTDYHRFHFPFAGTPGESRLINGPLYSVNPIALCQNIHILSTNKRCITQLQTESLGTVLLLEIGATCVGSIRQTYTAQHPVTKGDEKGYFRFGGSSTMVLFEPGRVQFDADLIENSAQNRELYARMGDRMATVVA
ncbi:archaetidylserine decarboxylase [Rhodopirellula sp. JC740]|uniref:phosphatidylserine decarboxylase n=1 Tax=Rhodopirellula halodulae TaxID=2894198 RepID=A0ABS8NKB8_9BACT|nr:archaetidylserine decarboxylase [Rhodopirellula sp. JC740]MCC9644000.1 archaetidylserine decarboxylase [Rhodopirellula sp. JC740]